VLQTKIGSQPTLLSVSATSEHIHLFSVSLCLTHAILSLALALSLTRSLFVSLCLTLFSRSRALSRSIALSFALSLCLSLSLCLTPCLPRSLSLSLALTKSLSLALSLSVSLYLSLCLSPSPSHPMSQTLDGKHSVRKGMCERFVDGSPFTPRVFSSVAMTGLRGNRDNITPFQTIDEPTPRHRRHET